jgi:hypothetical protein
MHTLNNRLAKSVAAAQVLGSEGVRSHRTWHSAAEAQLQQLQLQLAPHAN